MVRMKDVAVDAGVSVATVSNVITGKQYVSPDVKEKVEQSIKKLGYQVNLIARGLKSKRTDTIGVVLPDISKMFFPNVLKGITDSASKANYRVNFLSSNFDFKTERQSVDYLKASCADGIILDTVCPRDQLKEWSRKITFKSGGEKMPIVSLEQVMDESLISSVLIDYKASSRQITRHLIRLNKKKIMYLGASNDILHSYQRYMGYVAALEENAIPLNPALVFSVDFEAFGAYKAVKKALNDGLDFDAVQAVNDQTAIGALKALKEHGVAVPQRVAVAGFDNIFPSTLVTPQITTVNVPKYRLGKMAFTELKRLMDSPQAQTRSIYFDAPLIERQSTRDDIVEDWDLSLW